MGTALDNMINRVRNAQEVLQETRGKYGREMIGCFHPVVPEELIYAAGLLPVRLFPNFQESITSGNAHLQTFLCSYLRAVWDQVMKGDHAHLSGAIIPRSCEAVTFLYQTWKRHNRYAFIDYVNVPWKRSDNTVSFFARELARIKGNLEAFTGSEISEDALQRAIQLYNRNRALLRKVYDLRKSAAPPISGLEAVNVVMSGFLVDKAEHNERLEQFLKEQLQKPQSPGGDIRVLLSGGCVIDLRLWEMIASSGASIVADDVNNGSRSFWHAVDENTGNSLEALAGRYTRVPCAFNTSLRDRFEFISEMITAYQVNGVIFAINKNCESEAFTYPELENKIQERFGIPSLNIETDYLMGLAPLRTRVEAFVDILRRKVF